ncbi:hypothetical protein SK128_027611 [Halocaridina rubra]|uniref:Uncharacterized protein n=1 Tax=Halocaridina rubra TaxID=373956 RepID=A0AAN8XKZ1_HALRR
MSVSTAGSKLTFIVLISLAFRAYAHVGSCEDHTPQCRMWAASNQCLSNLQYMAANCPVSCNLCLDPGCFDRNRECAQWADRGNCVQFRFLMEQTCPHSCDFCKIDLGDITSAQSITSPDFQCGRPVRLFRKRSSRQILFPNEYEALIKGGQQPRPISANPPPSQGPTNPSVMRFEVSRPPTVPISIADAFCGSSVIHEHYLITAAHCVLDPKRPVRTVRVGEIDFSSTTEANSRPKDYEVERIIVHPNFKPYSLVRYNDIALIKTVEKIQFNELVYPLCISSVRPPPNMVVTGSGFGFVNNTNRSPILQEAELKIVDSRTCESTYMREGYRNELGLRFPQLLQGSDILCASFPGRDACQGDSGGPLYRDDPASGRRYLVGIVSFGTSCRGNGISSLPGFYISVSDHMNFINNVIFG